MSGTFSTSVPATGPLAIDGFSPLARTFNEFADRSRWQVTVEHIQAIPPKERDEYWQRADRFVQENGVAYNAFHDKDGKVRPWEVDLFPLVIAEAEWKQLSDALCQRARLLQAIVADSYGPQTLLERNLIPPDLVYGHPGYDRAFHDLPRPDSGDLALFGFELARSPSGAWFVMADRFDAVAGPGYALENRLAVSRTLPGAIKAAEVQRLAPFFEKLQEYLKSCAFRNVDDPRIVLLTGGPSQPGYFEDVFLAQYLGYFLVEGGDLAVREDEVFMKTVDGLLQVDVIFNRLRESELDPLEVTGATGIGVTGVVNAIRSRNVAVVNAPGYGLVESPIWMRFLPKLCMELLGEPLKAHSIATWWCGRDEDRKRVFDNLDTLVIKPAFEYSGGREYIMADLTPAERQDVIDKVQAQPGDYVAQERIQRSSAPTWGKKGFGTGYLALRAFLTTSVGQSRNEASLATHEKGLAKPDAPFTVMPGALVRVADLPQPLPLTISAGHSSKDAWILSSTPVQPSSLLPESTAVRQPRRNQHLVPCRVADNLFWFGRTLEAADFSARLLRSVLTRIESDRPNSEIRELPALIRGLSSCGLIDPDYLVAELAKSLPPIDEVITRPFEETATAKGIRSHVNELVRLASSSRDRISVDSWHAIRRLDELLTVADQPGFITEDALELLDEVLLGLAACSGLITDGTVRGAGWRFYMLGRRIGRAERMIEFFRAAWPESGAVPRSLLDAVLEVMDGRITYRSRYLADLDPLLVLDLLLIDDTNPRSLAYQLWRLDGDIDSLPRPTSASGLTALQRSAKRAMSDLQLADLGPLSDPETPEQLHQLLAGIEVKLKDVADRLVRRYLVLSGSARQRDEGPIRPI